MLWHRPRVKKVKAQAGFTLLELIVVIVILGTLAVYALPRFTGSGGYAEYGFQNRLVSVLRNMQIRAMQDSRPNFCHRINFINTTSQAAFGPATSDFSNGNQAASCSTSIDFTSPAYLRSESNEILSANVSMQVNDGTSTATFIQFDSFGNPTTSAGICAAGCQVDFSGDTVARVCIEAQGYVHAC